MRAKRVATLLRAIPIQAIPTPTTTPNHSILETIPVGSAEATDQTHCRVVPMLADHLPREDLAVELHLRAIPHRVLLHPKLPIVEAVEPIRA